MRWLPGGQFERVKGSMAEALDYCKKDYDFIEFGSLTSDFRKMNSFKDVLDKGERGEVSAIKANYPGLYIR